MSEPTCWTMIRGAAAGDERERERFGERYLPVVRAYLTARWGKGGRGPARGAVEDAVQEVFVECLREGGLLDRARRGAGAGFRGFLLGAARNVARRYEERDGRRLDAPRSESFDADALARDEATLSRAFDRAWAIAVLREAIERQAAEARGDPARERHVELLRLRFAEGLALREIAPRWGTTPKELHHEYTRALREFQRALTDVVAFHHPDAPEARRRECEELLNLVR